MVVRRGSAFSLCELLVAFVLTAIFLALVTEVFFWVRNFRIFNTAATRDLLCVRYFFEVECPEFLRLKREMNPAHFTESTRMFFAMGSKGLQEISKQQFDLGKELGEGVTLIEVETQPDAEWRDAVPIRVRFESPGHLRKGKRKIYEVHGIIAVPSGKIPGPAAAGHQHN